MISIYKITNNINDKVYIGQTIKTLKKRFKHHCQKSSGCIKMQRAIQKYGKENFKIEFIAATESQEDGNKLEIFFINYFKSIKSGYNIALGGINKISGLWIGRHHTEETKKKLSEANSAEKHYMYGKHLSEETKKKMSKASIGKPKSEETKKKMSKASIGKYLSEETKLKISEALSGEKNPFFGKHHTEEIKQKLSESHSAEKHYMYGKHLLEETKNKISESHRGEKSYLFGKPALNRKLTIKIAEQIREEYKSGKFYQKQLAEKYNIAQTQISKIINNKTYIN
jgi:group I intron endonuclease